jgi:hypothetical protein
MKCTSVDVIATTDDQSIPKRATKKKREIKSTNVESSDAGDPFLGRKVAFACKSKIGIELMSEFGKQWTSDAICYHLEPIAGHIAGSVMRRSKGIGCKSKDGVMKHDVVWEFSALGETLVTASYLLDGHITANELMKARENMNQSDGDLGVKIHCSRLEYVISDDEVSMPAPDSDETSVETLQAKDNSEIPQLEDEWCIFANTNLNLKTQKHYEETIEETEYAEDDKAQIGNNIGGN